MQLSSPSLAAGQMMSKSFVSSVQLVTLVTAVFVLVTFHTAISVLPVFACGCCIHMAFVFGYRYVVNLEMALTSDAEHLCLCLSYIVNLLQNKSQVKNRLTICNRGLNKQTVTVIAWP
jgi:hypothetical protein